MAHLGDAHRATGDLPSARRAWQEALEIIDELHLPDDLGVRGRIKQARTATAGRGPAGGAVSVTS
jgi:hypothetical protein